MSKTIRSIGRGLLATGVLLILFYFIGVYITGSDALRDALDPLTLRNYLALGPLVPGALLLWLSDYIAATAPADPPASNNSPAALPATGTNSTSTAQ